ncbi:MAG: autotransporter assembly complex family protein [Rhodospirillaceae bacterium]
MFRSSLPLLFVLTLTGLALGPAIVTAQPAAPYAVTITGVENGELRHLLESSSQLIQLKEETPPSATGLRRRTDNDKERLLTALRSEGYYDGTVIITIGEAVPAPVTLTVTLGQPYRFRNIKLTAAPGITLPPIPASALGLEPGAKARAPLVVAAEQKIKQQLGKQGFAFAKIADRHVTIDRAAKTLDIGFQVEPGPVIRLGQVRINGLQEIRESLVRDRTAEINGKTYSPERIEDLRTGLTRLGVFSSVRIEISETAAPDGSHPVTITLVERKAHYIGAGASFSSSEGISARAYWGHRNLFGGGERLRVQAEMARLLPRTVGGPAGLENADEKLSVELRKPDLYAVDQDLVVASAALNEHPQAYQRHAVTAEARLERKIDPAMTVGYGIAGEQSAIRDVVGTSNATLAGTPLSFALDTTNAPLDPSRGYRLTVETTPWLQANQSDRTFLATRITQRGYYDTTGDGRLVAAGRLSLGSIANGATLAVPADKRLYAGGGGSVRGYAYQKIGPMSAGGDPTGGRSLIETSAEIRVKITDTFGVVPFVDGGNVYSTPLPQPGEGMRFGAGVGMRYYTDFGPLRLDVGVPLQARPTDDPFQLYMSLGQAF